MSSCSKVKEGDIRYATTTGSPRGRILPCPQDEIQAGDGFRFWEFSVYPGLGPFTTNLRTDDVYSLIEIEHLLDMRPNTEVEGNFIDALTKSGLIEEG